MLKYLVMGARQALKRDTSLISSCETSPHRAPSGDQLVFKEPRDSGTNG